MTIVLGDRRAALKARHRAAIIGAARALVEERGGPTFSVDELAHRADVARRTIFNHFVSLDDVLLAACDEALAAVVEDFLAHIVGTPVGDGSRASMFDEIATAIRAADLAAAIAKVVHLVGLPAVVGDRADALTQTAFSRVAGRLLKEVERRNPGTDPLDAELLVGSLMNGVVVIAKHWITRTGAVVNGRSRAVWNELFTRLVVSIRSGYMPEQ